MVNYREILRLNSLGYSQRQIAASIQSSRDTIGAVCKLADQHGLEWPLPDELSNQLQAYRHTLQESTRYRHSR
jgi:hypothetical protein